MAGDDVAIDTSMMMMAGDDVAIDNGEGTVSVPRRLEFESRLIL